MRSLVSRLGHFSFFIFPFAFLAACSSAPKPQPISPSAAGVIRAVAGAQSAAARLAPHVAQEGKQALVSLEESLVLLQAEVARYEVLVNEQSVARQKAEELAAYEHSKRMKALKELWIWRGAAALILGCVAAWFALRSGLKLAL